MTDLSWHGKGDTVRIIFGGTRENRGMVINKQEAITLCLCKQDYNNTQLNHQLDVLFLFYLYNLCCNRFSYMTTLH